MHVIKHDALVLLLVFIVRKWSLSLFITNMVDLLKLCHSDIQILKDVLVLWCHFSLRLVLCRRNSLSLLLIITVATVHVNEADIDHEILY